MHKDPVVETAPLDWSAEKEVLAKDALTVLTRQYGGYKWGVEFSDDPQTGGISAMIVRLLDVPTDVVYVINAKDIDRDRMHCVLKAGGEFLEALGLKVGHARGWDVRGAKKTAAGLIIPDFDAMPETNPGYQKVKQKFEQINRKLKG